MLDHILVEQNLIKLIDSLTKSRIHPKTKLRVYLDTTYYWKLKTKITVAK